MKTTTEPDLIGDIHRTREALSAKFDHDLKALFADVIARQKQQGPRLVKPPPRTRRAD